MYNRDGKYSDPGDEFFLQDRSVYIKAVGVGAVQNDHFFASRRACVHQVIHGDVICVIAKADILYINHQGVKAIHVCGRGICGPASVERDGRQAGLLIHRILNLSPGIVLPPQPMLGHKYDSQIHFLPHKSVHDMLPVFHRTSVPGLSEGDQILSPGKGVCAGVFFISQGVFARIFFIFQGVCARIFHDLNGACVSAAGVRVLIFPGVFSPGVCIDLDSVSDDSCLICKKRDPLTIQHGKIDIRALISEDNVGVCFIPVSRFRRLLFFCRLPGRFCRLLFFRRLPGRFCRLRSCFPGFLCPGFFCS